MKRSTGPISTFLLIILALVPLISCGGSNDPDEGIQGELSVTLNKLIWVNALPGAVAKISIEDEGSWTFAKGMADLETGEDMDAEDKFRIASITKTFTAEMVLILADQGKLGLDDTVDKLVSDVPNGDRITVRMLLNHTSGIWDEDPDRILQEGLKNDPLRKWDPWEVFQAFTGGKVQREPGKQYEYSNAGYVLLGIIIEKVSEKPVQEVLAETITGPLEITDTYFPEGPEINGPHAHGYDGAEDVTEKIDPSWDFTAGAMISTAGDLHTWARVFAEGDLLSPEMHREQMKYVNVPNGRGQIRWGLGMENLFGWLGHNGSNTGWQSDMYYLPDKKATIVVLMNKESQDGSDYLANQQGFAWPAEVIVPDSVADWYLEAIAPPGE